MVSQCYSIRMLTNHKRWPLLFSELHQSGKIPKASTLTFLTLIPKKIEASFTHDFWPIRLISSPYKILVEVLSDRIKELLEAIDVTNLPLSKIEIYGLHSARNEIVEDFLLRKKKGTILKLNLGKAYDYINWDILDYMMAWKGFGKWRTWINGCLVSSHFKIDK